MRIAFRADASLEIGTGHVMRCLTLADALRQRGAQCCFICRPHAGNLLEMISHRGHQALALPSVVQDAKPNNNGTAHAHWLGIDWASDAQGTQQTLSNLMGGEHVDWLVVDHYALDSRWEKALRPCTKHIMVIDDLADRPHDCDVLLDQNLGRTAQDYGELLSRETKALVGPQYSLLRPEFAQWRTHSLARRARDEFKTLLITMGGVDKDNATCQILSASKNLKLPQDLRVTVVMGPQAPWLAQVQAQAEQMPWPTQVLVGVNNMAQIMAESDLAIGAAGGTAWERCSLGLPSLVLVLAKNQLPGAVALQKAGAAVAIETQQQISSILKPLQAADSAKEFLAKLSEAAAAVTDGEGCQRTVEEMLEGVSA